MKLPTSVLIAVILILLVASPLGAQAQEGGPLYVVQAGDALSRIAFYFGTSVEAIVAENGILNPNLLVPGTTLVIPGFYDLSGYITSGGEIKYGDSLESLSLLHGISPDQLARYNRWLNPERAYVGQPLILPQEIDAEAAVPTSRSILPASGDSLLEIAIRENINPWSAARTDQHADRLWIVPGNPLRLTSTDQATNAFPEPITGAQVNPQIMVQGKTVRIFLDYAGSSIVDGQLGEWSLSFHELEPERLVALQGVSAVAEPGTYDLEIRLRVGPDDPAYYAFRQPVPLIGGGYGFDPVLDVPGVTLDPATIAAEQQIWDLITGEATPERMWEGAFSYPATRTTVFPSVFGSRRNYNQQGYYNYHTGQDFYSLMGEPIPAAARGQVVMARSLTVRGNTVVIDHGWGVFTAYAHQSQMRVTEGDMVEEGQIIGLVGNTGRVAAPHLHWEVLVGGIPVDPLEWVETVFP